MIKGELKKENLHGISRQVIYIFHDDFQLFQVQPLKLSDTEILILGA